METQISIWAEAPIKIIKKCRPFFMALKADNREEAIAKLEKLKLPSGVEFVSEFDMYDSYWNSDIHLTKNRIEINKTAGSYGENIMINYSKLLYELGFKRGKSECLHDEDEHWNDISFVEIKKGGFVQWTGDRSSSAPNIKKTNYEHHPVVVQEVECIDHSSYCRLHRSQCCNSQQVFMGEETIESPINMEAINGVRWLKSKNDCMECFKENITYKIIVCPLYNGKPVPDLFQFWDEEDDSGNLQFLSLPNMLAGFSGVELKNVELADTEFGIRMISTAELKEMDISDLLTGEVMRGAVLGQYNFGPYSNEADMASMKKMAPYFIDRILNGGVTDR